MKHRLLISLLLSGMALGASAQKVTADLTSKLTNADFTADTPVSTTIRTYDYDMPDDGLGAGGEGLYGMQPVTGWEANTPSTNTKEEGRTDGTNARAAGVFAYEDDSSETYGTFGLGGDNYNAPFIEDGLTKNALGIVGVWGGNPTYSQNVDLPAGAYMLVVKVYNVAGAGTIDNLIGFVDDDTEYLSAKESYPVGQWINDTIQCRLEEAATVKVQLGFSFSSGSGSAPHLFFDNVKLFQIDESELIQAEIEAAKEELASVIELGRAYGADVSAALAVYNNPNATLDDVLEAIAAQEEINKDFITDLSEAFITNPHFTRDEGVVGGICTYDYDCEKNNISASNFSMLPVEGWTRTKTDNGCASGVYDIGSGAFLGGVDYIVPTEMSDGTSEGKVLGFVTCWTMAVQYTQNVTLPAGQYTLAMSYYNTGGTTAIDKNMIGFIADDGTEYLAQNTTFPVGKWTSEEVSFTLEEETTGYFSLGYKSVNTGSGNMPHFFTDGIALYYVGKDIDPSTLALTAAVSSANKVMEETFNADLKSELEQVVATGQELISTQSKDTEAKQAATQAINEKMEEVRASISAYKRLQDFYDGDLANALDKYEESAPSLYAELGLINDAVAEALDEQTWTTEQIDEAIASLPGTIRNYVQKEWDDAIASGEKLDEPLDISILFETLGVTFSTGTQQGASVQDKQWNYGDANNFKTQYGTMEVWNQSPFEVSQTLTDMPAGTYTITTRAFYRTADNATNYSTYVPGDDYAYVFAGHMKTGLTNVAAIASTNSEDFANSAEAADGIFVPNNQESAYKLFESEDYPELTKSVSTVLTSPGDLTFGVCADQMEGNSWVVWYTFELAYNAIDDTLLGDELEALMSEATDLLNSGCGGVKEAEQLLGDAIDQGGDAIDGDVAAKTAAINSLTSAIAYGSESSALVEAFQSAADYFLTLQETYNYTSSDTEFITIADAANSAQFDSNESVKTMTESLEGAWARFVVGQDLSSASEDTPVDMTGIILNADLGLGNSKYWTIGEDIGQNQGYQSASYTGEVTIEGFIEAWRPNGTALNDGDISQTLGAVLPAGYYVLECDGHATNQSAIPEEGITGAVLMAYCGDYYNSTSMGIEETSANPKHFAVAFYSDGVNPTTVGLRVAQTNASWLTGDNFMLSYVGSDAPSGIETLTSADVVTSGRGIYNLAGQKLNKLQKGINIVDGKKVFVK